ncbi:hypothetical protein ACFLRF_06410 [Candidatus Altiarchaeota archaeon]
MNPQTESQAARVASHVALASPVSSTQTWSSGLHTQQPSPDKLGSHSTFHPSMEVWNMCWSAPHTVSQSAESGEQNAEESPVSCWHKSSDWTHWQHPSKLNPGSQSM